MQALKVLALGGNVFSEVDTKVNVCCRRSLIHGMYVLEFRPTLIRTSDWT